MFQKRNFLLKLQVNLQLSAPEAVTKETQIQFQIDLLYSREEGFLYKTTYKTFINVNYFF